MRQVVSISLPAADVKRMKARLQRSQYRSLSAYIQYLLQMDQYVVSDAELLRTVRDSRKEYRAGKAIKASSMADLV